MKMPKRPRNFEVFVRERVREPVPYYSFFLDMVDGESVPAALVMSLIYDAYCQRNGKDNVLYLEDDIAYRTGLPKEQCEDAIEIWERMGVLKVDKMSEEKAVYEVNLKLIFEFLVSGYFGR